MFVRDSVRLQITSVSGRPIPITVTYPFKLIPAPGPPTLGIFPKGPLSAVIPPAIPGTVPRALEEKKKHKDYACKVKQN
jgi:hypothetical protein